VRSILLLATRLPGLLLPLASIALRISYFQASLSDGFLEGDVESTSCLFVWMIDGRPELDSSSIELSLIVISWDLGWRKF
jgi:hypothetical protein